MAHKLVAYLKKTLEPTLVRLPEYRPIVNLLDAEPIVLKVITDGLIYDIIRKGYDKNREEKTKIYDAFWYIVETKR